MPRQRRGRTRVEKKEEREEEQEQEGGSDTSSSPQDASTSDALVSPSLAPLSVSVREVDVDTQEVLGAFHLLTLENLPMDAVRDVQAGKEPSPNDRDSILSCITYNWSSDALTQALVALHPFLPTECVDSMDSATSSGSRGRRLLGILREHLPHLNGFLSGALVAMSSGCNERSVLVARVYISLLRLPAATAYKIFHPNVMRGVLNLIRSWVIGVRGGIMTTQAGRKRARDYEGIGRRGRGKRRQEREDLEGEEREEEGAGEEEEEEERDDNTDGNDDDRNTKNKKMSNETIRQAIILLEDLGHLLASCSLRAYPDLIVHAADVFIDIAKLRSYSDTGCVPNATDQAYRLLRHLLLPAHGTPSPNDTARIVMKALVPLILMTFAPLSATTIPRPVQAVRGAALLFVRSLIEDGSGSFTPAVPVLLQHLCTQVPEKAEYRSHAATALVPLLQALPPRETPRFTRFLVRLTHNHKVGTRVLALEIAQEMLVHPSLLSTPFDDDEDESLDDFRGTTPLLRVLLHRASDKAPSVRAKALSSLAQVMRSLQQVTLGSEIVPIVRRRLIDEKSGVRRAALQVFEVVARSENASILSQNDLLVFQERCQDPSVAIRKQAITSLTAVLQAHPDREDLRPCWLTAILPCVTDTEVTIQDKCLEALEDVVFQRISSGDLTELNRVWGLLSHLDSETIRFLQRAVALLAKRKQIHGSVARAVLRDVCERKGHKGAFVVLEALSMHAPTMVDASAVLRCWRTVDTPPLSETTWERQYLIRSLGALASHLHRNAAAELRDTLLDRIRSFAWDPEDVGPIIHTLVQLCRTSAKSPREATAAITEWAASIASECDERLFALSFAPPPGDGHPLAQDPSSAIRFLFTVGEIASHAPGSLPHRLITTIQALVAPTLTLPPQGSTVARTVTIPPSVRANGFITLGKVCLEDSSLTKKCINMFVRELEMCDSAIVRNNVLVVLCDLCKRYTSLVDRFASRLALPLRDPNELVRRHALMMLTNLLQEDYLKWKGGLFFRFALTLVDPSPPVRGFASFCLLNILFKKNPTIFSLNFVETLFVFNGFTEHPTYNQFPQTDGERDLFSLRDGDKAGSLHAQRKQIYIAILEKMVDEDKFQVTSKLCQDVLGGVVDGVISLETGSSVVLDALVILASKAIKLSALQQQAQLQEGEVEEETTLQVAAKGKILSQMVRKNTIENIVPILVSLKKTLEAHHSFLLGHLMTYLRELLRDYKEEISEIMAEDRQLAAEIEYDIQQWEAQKRHKERPGLGSPSKGSLVAMAVTPVHPTPKPSIAAPGPLSVPRLRNSSAKTPLRPTPRHDPSSKDDDGKTPFSRRKRVLFASPVRDPESEEGTSSVMPLVGVLTPSRAPPTPTAQSPSITSHVPIPSSLPIRLYSMEENASPSKEDNVGGVVTMPRPDEASPKPRTWNITSPGGRGRGEKRRGLRLRQPDLSSL